MKIALRSGLFMALMVLLLAGVACAKKTVDTETPVDGGYGDEQFTPEEQAAVSQISNGTIYFAYDSFDLRSDSKNVLAQKANVMKQFPQLRVVIEGHCDERGTEEYNLALGERRARAAYEFLINLGIPGSQMDMVSFGKLHPVAHGGGESTWAQNRRDEFKVTKKTY